MRQSKKDEVIAAYHQVLKNTGSLESLREQAIQFDSRGIVTQSITTAKNANEIMGALVHKELINPDDFKLPQRETPTVPPIDTSQVTKSSDSSQNIFQTLWNTIKGAVRDFINIFTNQNPKYTEKENTKITSSHDESFSDYESSEIDSEYESQSELSAESPRASSTSSMTTSLGAAQEPSLSAVEILQNGKHARDAERQYREEQDLSSDAESSASPRNPQAEIGAKAAADKEAKKSQEKTTEPHEPTSSGGLGLG